MFFSMNPRNIAIFVAILLLSAAAPADQTASVSPPPMLPQQFAGWRVKDSVTKSPDAAAADPTNAPVLQEYGFQRFEKGTYTRDDGAPAGEYNVTAQWFTRIADPEIDDSATPRNQLPARYANSAPTTNTE